jgi:pimeloyl-ACP methyl ester carboxylesterase
MSISVALALMHPRLLHSIVLLDPVIQERSAELDEKQAQSKSRTNLAQLSTFRRDIWPSREEAAASFAKSAFYKTWDKRVLERWVQYGLRDTPTALHPDAKPPQVTLSTTPAQEVFTYLRPNYEGYGVNGKPVNRSTHADLDPARKNLYPFYRAESPSVYNRLPEVRPGIFYIFGETSAVSHGDMNREKMLRTGIGVGGSGGVEAGRVKDITLPRVGHLIPMEDPERTADEIAEWVGVEMPRFTEELKSWEIWQAKTLKEKSDIDEQWSKTMGGPPKRAKL